MKGMRGAWVRRSLVVPHRVEHRTVRCCRVSGDLAAERDGLRGGRIRVCAVMLENRWVFGCSRHRQKSQSKVTVRTKHSSCSD